MSDSLWPYGLQHTGLPCPSTTPRACSNWCPFSRWCHWVSNATILCRSFLLLPSIFSSNRVFSNQLALPIRWPKYWSSSFSINLPMNIQDWFPLGLTVWIYLQAKGLLAIFSSTIVQKHQFFSAQLSLWYNSHVHTWLLEKRIHLQWGRPGFYPWVGKIPWRRERLPTPVFWLGEFHGYYIIHLGFPDSSVGKEIETWISNENRRK